jgi:phosphoglycolate phosphatase
LSVGIHNHIVFDCDGTLIDTSQFKYRLYPGIKELLLALSAESKLYVWTARDRLSTLRILQEQGVYQLFESICTVDDALPKPHISGILELVGNSDKSHICMIGDTTSDILGAKNFGIKSIGATWNKNANGPLMKETGATYLAVSPEECLPWILENIYFPH